MKKVCGNCCHWDGGECLFDEDNPVVKKATDTCDDYDSTDCFE